MRLDINQMTTSLQEGLMTAKRMATNKGHQEVDTVHLFLSFLQEDHLFTNILRRSEFTIENVKQSLQHLLERKPRVSGSGADLNSFYLTNEFKKNLVKSRRIKIAMAGQLYIH